MATTIPLIDFEKYGLHVNSEDVPSEDLTEIGDQIVDAFRTIGFCYIKNHGIPKEKVDKMFRISKTFFNLPTDVKQKHQRTGTLSHGWMGLEAEKLVLEKPGDYKEFFGFTPKDRGSFPDVEVPEMRETFADFFDVCKNLAYRILDVLDIGMKLEDRNFLRNCHGQISGDNYTSLTSILYPKLPDDGSIKPGQQRCAEHTDLGTVTVLFQDDIGGLEVCNTDGEFIAATPVPDAICVNIGDMMQRWTADKLLATKHRVLIPEDEFRRNRGRQSIAYFILPDEDTVIKCLDGSDKYEPITTKQYTEEKFNQIF